MVRGVAKEIKEALDGNPLLRKILDSIQDGIVIVDEEFNISYVNASAGILLGIDRNLLLGRKVDELPLTMHGIGGEKISKESQPFSQALKSNPIGKAQQVIIKRPDGSAMPVLFNIQSDSKVLVGILTDSSALLRKKMQAEEYNRLLAHDIRNPLAVILGHSEILKTSPEDFPDRDESINAILESGKLIESMTSEMVDRMNLETGNIKLEREEVNPEKLIREVILVVDSKKNRKINLKESNFPQMKLDRYRFKRIISNLLSNAIKYSEEDTEITISCCNSYKGLTIIISDQGRGIEPEDQSFIFDPFFITSIGRERGGVGLGLYISRLIVEAHGGRIYVSSGKEGTSFGIFLPKKLIVTKESY